MFDGHYVEWRLKRIAAIKNYYGKSFFQNKTILELGCGFGDIGASFHELGAKITCNDARMQHLEKAKSTYPFINIICADIDKDWPFDSYDIIFHLGVLYHLKNFEISLRKTCESCNYLVLESEVCDSDDPSVVFYPNEAGYDQAFNNVGCRPSPHFIERILTENNMKYELVSDDRCNSNFHVYDWKTTNTKIYKSGLRRFWFCKRQS